MKARPNVVILGGGFAGLDVLVSFPPHVPGQRYANLPVDHRGFILVDPESCRVKGRAATFAVGDIADFPIKQAFLALLQADAAADHIRAAIKGKAPEVNFEPMSRCVMDELNKATFAQVPLRYTYDPVKPVTVAAEDVDQTGWECHHFGGLERRRWASIYLGDLEAENHSMPAWHGEQWTSALK